MHPPHSAPPIAAKRQGQVCPLPGPAYSATAVTAFFVGLGLEVEGTRMFVEGEFLDTVIGIPDSRTEIVMLRPPTEVPD